MEATRERLAERLEKIPAASTPTFLGDDAGRGRKRV